MRRLMYVALCAVILVVATMIGLARDAARSRQAPGPFGVRNSSLLPCPDSPNCVVSKGGEGSHAIEPLRFEGDPAEAMRRLREVLGSLPRVRIVMDSEPYLHAEAQSRLFGFVDDLEFLIDPEGGRIDFRSASRVGWSDMGVNRARARLIAQRFATAQAPADPSASGSGP